MNKIINIPPIIATQVIQQLALYCSSYLGNDIYYMKEAMFILINYIGEDELIKMMKNDESGNKTVIRKIGENWNNPKGMKRKLQKISLLLEKINKSYIILEDKTLTKKNKENIGFDDFSKYCKEFVKIENDFYALSVFLIANSSMQKMSISSQYLKVLDNMQKTFGTDNKDRLQNMGY